MLLKPRSSQPAKTPFIASAIVVAAVIATLGLTRGDLVATALAMPFSAASAADASAPPPMACEHHCHPVQAIRYLPPSENDTRGMERVILAQIAAVRSHDAPTACRYVASYSAGAFTSDPTTSLQRLTLLATSEKLAFSDVTIGPCHHDGYVTVTGFIHGKPTYIAHYVVATEDVVHPHWGIASVDVALPTPPTAKDASDARNAARI